MSPPVAPPPQTDWPFGHRVTAADLNTRLRDPVNFLRAVPQTMAYRTGAGTLASTAAYSVATWDTYLIDTNSGWSATTPTRVTVQAPGRYMVTTRYAFGVYAGGYRFGMVRMNSGADPAGGTFIDGDPVPITSGAATVFRSTMYVNCVAGDYFELFVYQTSGTTQNILTGVQTNLAIRWIGR